MQRLALDALRSLPNGEDAIAQLVLLEDQHGHHPGKRFPLNFDAMRAAGLLNLSKPHPCIGGAVNLETLPNARRSGD